MKLRYLILALCLPVTSFAEQILIDQLATGTVQIVKCPAVSDEYSTMLTKLDTLKASIKKDANCQQISDRLDKVAKLTTDRDKFLELVEKAKTTTLTDAELKIVSTYTENITQKIGNLVELISNNGTCFQSEGDQQSLTLLSGFISEAVGLFSQVAGPWGAPVALGGQLISGFISGLDKVMKNRTGYNFKDRNQWASYVQNLCTYQALRGDLDTLLHPQERINTLKDIQRKLDMNLTNIQSQCADCKSLQMMNDKQAQNDAHVLAVDYQYGMRLGLLSVRVRLAQAWVASEISRIYSESNAYWNNVSGKTLLASAQRDMEGFLIEKEAPSFIDFQVSQTISNLSDLNQFLLEDGTAVVHLGISAGLINANSIGSGYGSFWSPSYAPIYKVITEPDWRAVYRSTGRADDDLEFRLVNARKSARSKFETASWSFGTAFVFCDFFKNADLYSASINRSCGSNKFKAQMKSLADIDAEMMSQWNQASANQNVNWTEALNIWTDQVQKTLSTQLR